MTLVVTTRVPDGIVVAADSLATLPMTMEGTAKGPTVCPHCGQQHEVEIPVKLPTITGTLATLPYALKVIPMYKRYALAAFGASIIGTRTIFSLVREFEREHQEPAAVKNLPQDLGNYLFEHLTKAMDVKTIPKGGRALGFHLSGYEQASPLTFITSIGRDVGIEEYGDFGVTVSGETGIVTKLWELKQTHPQMGSAYQAWSVLDAVDYAKFLISTTSNFQRFATMVPNVGGDIDIVLVTPQRFSWVQRKPLVDLLLQQEGGKDDKQNG